MIAKSIGVSIIKTSLKKLRLQCGEYEYTDAGGFIRNDGSTII